MQYISVGVSVLVTPCHMSVLFVEGGATIWTGSAFTCYEIIHYCFDTGTTVVSHGRLNINRNFGQHGCLPRT